MKTILKRISFGLLTVLLLIFGGAVGLYGHTGLYYDDEMKLIAQLIDNKQYQKSLDRIDALVNHPVITKLNDYGYFAFEELYYLHSVVSLHTNDCDGAISQLKAAETELPLTDGRPKFAPKAQELLAVCRVHLSRTSIEGGQLSAAYNDLKMLLNDPNRYATASAGIEIIDLLRASGRLTPKMKSGDKGDKDRGPPALFSDSAAGNTADQF
jgi:hypothetical protein